MKDKTLLDVPGILFLLQLLYYVIASLRLLTTYTSDSINICK